MSNARNAVRATVFRDQQNVIATQRRSLARLEHLVGVLDEAHRLQFEGHATCMSRKKWERTDGLTLIISWCRLLRMCPLPT